MSLPAKEITANAASTRFDWQGPLLLDGLLDEHALTPGRAQTGIPAFGA